MELLVDTYSTIWQTWQLSCAKRCEHQKGSWDVELHFVRGRGENGVVAAAPNVAEAMRRVN